MRVRVAAIVATTAIATAGLVTSTPAPAGAATVTVNGNQITVTSTVDETISLSCSTGTVRVNGAPTSPTVQCADLTKVTVTSINSTDQTVEGDDLNNAAFVAGPTLTANLGGGDDEVTESDRSDTINLGGGDDELNLRLPTAANASLDLGADTDWVKVRSTTGDDTTSGISTNNTLTVQISSTGGATSYTVGNAERVELSTLTGNDTVSTTGITAASTVDFAVLAGNEGDDNLDSGVVNAQMQGGTGTNDFDGGAGNDVIVSASETDVINTGGGTNKVLDATSLRAGGRTVTAGTGVDGWYLGAYPGDAVVRIRSNGGGGTSKIITSLTRPGRQTLPSTYDTLEVNLNEAGEPQSAALVDLIALGVDVSITGNSSTKEVLDIYIPSGSWSSNAVGLNWTIDPSNGGYGTIKANGFFAVNVHGPFSSTEESYAHRVIRDLLLRVPGTTERNQLRDDLDDNTKTPTTAVLGIMDTDEYRGLDVDRVFVKYLRRVADPGGRTYWINSLDNGKALWRFRAQLFGGNEYFTKAGGTNASYVTRAYSDVLGRAPDPSGQTYWTNKLNNGADRGQVALQFMNSPEARRRLVDDQYLRFLERYPTPAEQNLWVGQIPTDTGEISLIRTLATTNSYYQFD